MKTPALLCTANPKPTNYLHPCGTAGLSPAEENSVEVNDASDRETQQSETQLSIKKTITQFGTDIMPDFTPGPPEPPSLHKAPAKRSPFGAMLNRSLPAYMGPYKVGVADIEVPVASQSFGNFRHKAVAGNAGLTMDTVFFTLFYPADPPTNASHVVWFPRLRQTIDGFIKMAHRTPNLFYRAIAYPAAAAAIWGTTFPAYKEASLLTPPNADQKWPLMIFSHGVGCSRLMYSAFCGEMASRGYVVAALEHRDGTSPSSKITGEHGDAKVVDWLDWRDLEWPDLAEQPKDDTILRHQQLKLRCAEISEAIKTVGRLSQGEKLTNYAVTSPEFDWEHWKCVDVERPIVVGHSLGGTAALMVSAQNEIPFRAIVVMDPATQRMEPWTGTIPHPLLVINSEEFVTGREYEIFAGQVARTVKDAPVVFSIPGATHPSFSDVFLILPTYLNRMTGLRVDAFRVLELTVETTADFLNGDVETRCHATTERRDGEEVLQKPVGTPGELVWHPFKTLGH